MNISAKNIILHALKYSPEGVLECTKREGELPISPSIEQFLTKIHRTYQSKTNKAFASFLKESEKPQVFQRALEKEMSGELDFVRFSHTAVDCLLAELQKQDFAEQGILLVSKYSWTASDYLLIALLQNNESVSVNENLELTTSQYLETSKIQLVTRIDLTLLARSPDSNRYLSFIKGRVGRQVSDFFLDFMGAQEGFDAKIQNQVLMKAVEEFCEKEALPIEKKQEVRAVTFDYCKEQLKQGEDIDLSTLSEQLQETPKLEGSFYDFVSEDYQLEKNFPADRSVMRKLTKYVGQGGGVSISFDQKHLGERIQYDADSDTLTIKGIPPNLREQLKRDAVAQTSQTEDDNSIAPF
ncbi:nucleoid-associated protein YejK [Psychromonas hadalis]|uniref:nucleoid-associated protein YejK n=1 Tax=Psychromonas hadalis TaxID=211669 RepID=UPI0003B64FEA|nr:nucleoid-associated protein YejK [Psychromonas hadalis]